MKKTTTPGLVEAVGVATVSSRGGQVLAAKIASAMSQSVLALNARGVSTEEKHSPLIRACMMASREAVKASHQAGEDTSIQALVANAVAETLKTFKQSPS